MWQIIAGPEHALVNAKQYLDYLHPDEQHNAGGDCVNPQCNYQFTPADETEIMKNNGWFACPQCGYDFNYLDPAYNSYGTPGGNSRAPGLTNTQLGNIGEAIVRRQQQIPGVGTIIKSFDNVYQNPIDFIIGKYGVEVKTNHSESQPRFKIGGEKVYDSDLDQFVPPRQGKINYCVRNNLVPALLGVRLNFYTSKADLFFREGLIDTWIGNSALQHVMTVDFRDLNPYPHPQDVPPASELPQDDDDGIPF